MTLPPSGPGLNRKRLMVLVTQSATAGLPVVFSLALSVGHVATLLDGERHGDLARQAGILAKLGLVAARDRLQALLDLPLNERCVELATASNIAAAVQPDVAAHVTLLDGLAFAGRLSGALALLE